MSESILVRDILIRLGSLPGVRLFRNNTGRLRDREGRWVAYGLCVGSSDIIGWKVETDIAIPGIAEGPIARFVALECKVKPRKPTPEQVAFILAVDRAGGIAGVVYSVEDAAALLSVPLPQSRKCVPTNRTASDRQGTD